MANHLAMAAIIEPGDEVLIEHPAYGPILDVARYLDAKVKRFSRREENGWPVGCGRDSWCHYVQDAPHTSSQICIIQRACLRLIRCLREVGDIARGVGALVLVDEVYLDAVYKNTPRTSISSWPPSFVVTSSLTKFMGVSGYAADGSWRVPISREKCVA
jgi:aspartate/methionine/tyrosine aminotransferase